MTERDDDFWHFLESLAKSVRVLSTEWSKHATMDGEHSGLSPV